ncbi:MAG: ATP-binding cassette domain-containing protein [Candidatus Hydrogenedentota bacterium]|nr:MAG: ATP-binding cassette domain-containing protein [Candidatus Hydrogenedentota bacterium]
MGSEQVIYQLENITKSYGDATVLNIGQLSLMGGQTCALVGPNGSGKTTLLKLLALIERPTSGEIVFDSMHVWDGTMNHTLLARRITMVTHPPFLFNRSVGYNIAYGMKLRGMSRKHIREKTLDVLRIAGLEDFRKRDARKLSSGEQQRVALARALALEPEVLLLDEPTASVDKKHAEEIESLIRQLASEKRMTVIFSTHNYHQAAALAGRIISLYDGRVESFAYENLFAGTIFKDDGVSRIKLNSEISIDLISGLEGPAHISIDPRDISVSRQPISSASLHCYRGKIVSMTMHDSEVQLIINVGVRLTSIIAKDSLKQLRLKLGEEVYCLFEPGAVKII